MDAFWKAIESGANKRGQVGLDFLSTPVSSSELMYCCRKICVNMCEKRQKKTWFSMGEVRRFY